MSLWECYHIAQSTDDALRALRDATGTARIVAGGTDLLLDMQQGRGEAIHTLVDINEIPEMCSLEVIDGELFIGAAVTLRRITTSDLVREHCEALSTACGLIGGPQVRNTATLGGNVAHALPAADGTIALLALDAEADIADRTGRRRAPLAEVFRGPGQSALDPTGEILTGFWIRLRKPGQSSAFNRIMRPQGVAIAILNLAVFLETSDGSVVDARVAIGPSGPVPRRMREAEKQLCGGPVSSRSIDLAASASLSEASLRTSRHRATTEYRRAMVRVLMEKTVEEAAESALK